MANDFGFIPVKEGTRYFISYKSEDAGRVGEIARALNEKCVPMWYDYGIEKGKLWGQQITVNLEACDAILLFVTKKVFAEKDTYVYEEYRLATDYGKKICVVWLENIAFEDVHVNLKPWFHKVQDLQGIKMSALSADEIAWHIINDFHLEKMAKPQPPTPQYAPEQPKPVVEQSAHAPQPTPQPAPKPAPQPAPQPAYTPTTTRAATTQTRAYAQPTQSKSTYTRQSYEQEKRENSSQKDAIIFTVALMLVVAIVVGIVVNTVINSDNSADNSSSDEVYYSVYDSSKTDYSTYDIDDISSVSALSVGDRVVFGTYEQDNDTSNGTEDISWIVLAIDGDEALLLTEYLLDYVPYNEEYTSVTWETCTLRTWMNDTFYNAAFTSEEQAKIVTSTLSNNDNPTYGTEGGNDTEDKIFALSIDEAEDYFSGSSSRKAYTTDYAHAKGYDYSDGSDWWWLRSSGHYTDDAADVFYDGGISSSGDGVNSDYVAVRLACWVKL